LSVYIPLIPFNLISCKSADNSNTEAQKNKKIKDEHEGKKGKEQLETN